MDGENSMSARYLYLSWWYIFVIFIFYFTVTKNDLLESVVLASLIVGIFVLIDIADSLDEIRKK